MFAEIFGWTPNELTGQPGEAVYPSMHSYAALGAIAMPVLSAARQLDLEWEMKRKNGSVFLARMIAKIINPDNPSQGTVWIVEDVAERKRASGEPNRLLREQEAILQTASVGIFFVRDRRIMRCTRRFEEMYGYAPGELNGEPTVVLYRDEADFQKIGEAYAQLAKGPPFTLSTPVCRKDGSTFWARITGRATDLADAQQGSVWLTEDVSEQRRADEDVRRLLNEQNAIRENALIGIAFLKDHRIMRCNRRFEEIFGYAQGALLNQPAQCLYASDRASGSTDPLNEGVWSDSSGSAIGQELRMKKRDGSEFWCFLSGRAVQSADPAQGSVWLFEDVTADKAARDRIRRFAREQELILQNATAGIAFVRDRVIQRANRYLDEMTGQAAGTLVGQSSEVLFAERADWEVAGRLAYEGAAPGQTHVNEVRFKRSGGGTFLCRTVGRRIDAGGDEQEWIWSFEDVSAERATLDSLERSVAERTAQLQAANARLEAEIGERKQAENRARHLADHDVLTGLPNRRILEDRLTQALALSDRNRKQTAAMFIDPDRFKSINDSLGHAAGDLLLKEVARRLVRQLRVGDTVCRIGGDEFVVVLPEIVRGADVAQVAQKIIETLSEPMLLEGHDIAVTPSIGISVFPEDGSDAEALIRNADAAMYHAEEMGRGNFQLFTEQMNLAASPSSRRGEV